MRKSLTIFVPAGLFLLLFAAGASVSGAQEAQAPGVPPVAQPLVREGDFAVELAPAFALGSPGNETEAEDLLAAAGVVPANGWLSDYPVTPEILGQIREAAAGAASAGKLSMNPDEATRRLYDLASKMGLPVPAGGESAGPAGQAAPEPPVIYDYYEGYGPPIITYYPPPPAYLYLYVWVPYPVWWYSSWYPGFYICNNFSTTIIYHSRRVFVRNRYVDPLSRQVVRIDPVVRTPGNRVRSRTILRTDDGRTYRNIRELREGTVPGRADRGGRGAVSNRRPAGGGYRSPQDRKSAGEIYQRSVERQGAAGRRGGAGPNANRRSEDRGARQGGGFSATPPRSDLRSYNKKQGRIDRGAETPGLQRSDGNEEKGLSRQYRPPEPTPGVPGGMHTRRPSRPSDDNGENGQGRYPR